MIDELCMCNERHGASAPAQRLSSEMVHSGAGVVVACPTHERRAVLPVITLLAIWMGVPCWAQAPVTPAREDPAREYQMRIQQVADLIVVPRLTQALSSEERTKLGAFRVEVIQSRDSLRIELHPKLANTSRLVVSVGNMFVHDLLVEASVVWASTRRDEDAIAYAIDVTEYALQARRPGSPRTQPKPFWELLGWDQKKYEAVHNEPSNQKLFAKARVQTLAWIVARAISVQMSDGADRAWISESAGHEGILLARTADLMMRAKFAPVPALGSSIFFYGVQHPKPEYKQKWLCAAEQVLVAAMTVAEADRGTADDARAARIDATVAEWERVGQILNARGKCTRE